MSACPATAAAPRTSREAPGPTAPRSTRSTTSGSSTASERVEVAAARGGQERVDDLSLAGEVGVGHRGGAPYAAAGPAGELAGGGGRAIDDRSDLVERHAEHVVQDEREPLGG